MSSAGNDAQSSIPIGISSCLIGEKVRFDGGHKQNRYVIDTLGQYVRFKPFCPEVTIGLGIPGDGIRLVSIDARTEAIGSKHADRNFTRPLIDVAQEQASWHQQMFGYIVNKDSPSCGMERMRLYQGEFARREGVGLYTATRSRARSRACRGAPSIHIRLCSTISIEADDHSQNKRKAIQSR